MHAILSSSMRNLWSKLLLMTTFVLLIMTGSQPVQAAATVEGVETPGVFRVGMEANYAPFNWTQTNDANGAVAISNSEGEYANGYDLQVAKRLADGLGLELEIVKLEWDGLPPAVMSGKIDAIIAGMSPTAQRKEQIDFTDNYYTSDMVIVVRKDSPLVNATSLADFKGTKITGQLNTFHYSVIDQIPGVDKQTAMDNFPSMISATISGKIDGYVSERPGAMAAVAANPDLTYVAFETGKGFEVSFESTSIAIGIAKGSPLAGPINEALANFSEEDRGTLMQKMIDLNVRGESKSFLESVWQLLHDYGSSFVTGTITTLWISIISTIIGFIIGLAVAAVRTIKIKKASQPVQFYLHRIVDWLLAAYIEVFRGTPMMVQSMLIFYGSKLFLDIDMSSIAAAFLIVSINTGAYLAEVVRGGIESIDPGQTEAAKAIGMTHTQTMLQIILPQAIRNILPALGNEFVINIKDTSVLNVIAVAELFFITKSAAGSTYLIFQAYFIASVIYFFLTFTTTRLLRLVEKRMDGASSYELLTIEGGEN